MFPKVILEWSRSGLLFEIRSSRSGTIASLPVPMVPPVQNQDRTRHARLHPPFVDDQGSPLSVSKNCRYSTPVIADDTAPPRPRLQNLAAGKILAEPGFPR